MRIGRFILSLLFPSQCIVCDKAGSYLCRECFDHIPLKHHDLCPICQKTETFAGRVCNTCENGREKFYLDGLIVASYYKYPVLREAIYRFKYGFIRKLAWPLAKIILKKLFLLETFPFEEFVFSVVPLHQKRQKWRGFNQVELIGRKLQKLFLRNDLEIIYLPSLLIREKYFGPQMKIKSDEERKKNVVGCFLINDIFLKKIPPKIILLDDIATTSATLNECAKVLKRHGAEKVWGLVLARQGR